MKKLTVLSIFLVAVLASGLMFGKHVIKGIFSDKKEVAEVPDNAAAPTKTLYDFTVQSIEGKTVSLNGFKGKKVVLLNVASKCGYTPQYADWEKFYKEHGKNIVVLGFPANNFMSQEPGSNEEIATFCQKNYGVTFPMFEKVEVVGDNQHPLYKWQSTKSLNGWNDKAPSWNFCKYVINEKGQLTHFFASGVKPTDPEFKKAVGI